jgi:hypothetical protein
MRAWTPGPPPVNKTHPATGRGFLSVGRGVGWHFGIDLVTGHIGG